MTEPIITIDSFYYLTDFKGFQGTPHHIYFDRHVTHEDLFMIDCMQNFLQAGNYQTIIFSDTALENIKKDFEVLMQTITNIKNGNYVIRLKDFSVLISKDDRHLIVVEFKYNVYQAGFCHTLSKGMNLIINEDGEQVFKAFKGLFLANDTDFEEMFTLQALTGLQYLQKMYFNHKSGPIS